jgi:O-antigen ligase
MNARVGWAFGLWLALLAGILVAWTPRYWAVAIAITAVSLVVVCRAIRARDIRLPLKAVLVAPIGAFGFMQLALHTTVLPHLTAEASLVWFTAATAFVAGADILCDRAARRLFLDLILWSLTFLAVAAMLQAYLSPDRIFGIFPATPGGFGTLLSGNQFAAMMELAAPIALWRTMDGSPVTGGLCFVMILAAALTTASRAGVLLIVAELMVFFILLGRRRQLRTLLAVLGILVLVVGAAAIIAGVDQIKIRFAQSNPYGVRRQLLKSTIQLIDERPATGYGLGTWRSVYPRFATFDENALANEAHNDWAEWTSEGGFPFSILMAVLVISIAGSALRSVWGLGLIGVMAHSFVDYPIREPALAFLWFALAGVASQHDLRRRGSSGRNSVAGIANNSLDNSAPGLR